MLASTFTALCVRAGEVQEFGFREIADSEPKTTSFATGPQPAPSQQTEGGSSAEASPPSTSAAGVGWGKLSVMDNVVYNLWLCSRWKQSNVLL